MGKNKENYLDTVVDVKLSLVEEPPQLMLFDETDSLIEKYRKSNSNKINVDHTFNYTPVIAEGHTAPYKIHKYFARRPWNVFEQLVKNFSKENEIVLDPFCGGGVTVYESIRKGRKVIGCDLNPLSIFVVRNMVKKNILNPDFITAIDDLKKYLLYLNGSYMQFTYEGMIHQIEWCEVAFKVKCNICNEPTLLSNEYKTKNGAYKCINSECASHNSGKKCIEAKNCERLGFEYLFLANNNSQGKKIVKQFEKADFEKLNSHIEFLKSELKKEKVVIQSDKIPMDWDRQFEDGLAKKGIINFQDLFTERNLLIVSLLLNKIKSYSSKLSRDKYELLRMIFSNTVKDTNIMAFTNETWQGGKPTTWSKHAYWIPSQFCEVSILPSFEKGVQRIISSLNFNNTQKYEVDTATTFSELTDKNILLYNKPVAYTDIPDNSVDAIITDPPYGSNVQYLELSHFWYVWNRDLYDTIPNFELEAISNRKKGFIGAKTMYDYEDNLYNVFLKSYQVLKPNKYMVLTFNNKDVTAWLGLLFSIFRSGFTLSENGLFFQDGVKNYKQTAHTKADGSPYGDFIYSFKKGEPTHEIKNYVTENEFSIDLDNIFKHYLSDDARDKNELILDMFLTAIPIIESFAKSYLINNKHTLYTKFKKIILINSIKMPRISEEKLIKDNVKFEKLFPDYVRIIDELQSKFKVTDGSAFTELVNFKNNKKIPKHNWYEYKQGYAEDLVKQIIEAESPDKKHYILDPFCGVGTSNVVAQSLGYKSIGFDINPVAYLAASVKTHFYTLAEIQEIQKLIKSFKPGESSVLNETPKVIDSSFQNGSLESLYQLKYFWENITNNIPVQQFFQLAYLSIIEDCSIRTKDGNGIKLNLKKKKIENIFQYFLSKCNSMVKDIEVSNFKEETIFINGSITLNKYFKQIENNKVGLCVFSPPYANCFDYCEVYKLEFWLGGFVKTYKDFAKYRSIAMRSHVNSQFDHNIKNYQKEVDLIADIISAFNIWNKNIPDMLRGYFDDTYELLKNIKTVLVKDAKCFIVVANSGYKGILVPTDLLIAEIATSLGYKVNQIYYARKIRSSSQQMKELHLEYEDLMRESIIEIQN